MSESYYELWHNEEKSWLVSKNISLDFNTDEYLLVKAKCSLVSLGTERLLISSKVWPTTEDRMKVPYMKGSFQNSFTYGYSLVGEVIIGPDAYNNKIVHLLHPHQELALVKKSDVSIVPDGLSMESATLASNMETAVNAIWDSEMSLGDNILIVGYGIIGAMVALIAKNIPGVNVVILEMDELRANKANNHGYRVISSIDKNKYNISFNTSGNEIGLQLAIDSVVIEGKVIELSWYGSKAVNIALGDSFHYGRKKIISSQVSAIPGSKSKDWDFIKRKKLVFDLLHQLKPDFLLDHKINFKDTPTFFNLLRESQVKDMGVTINYN